MTELEKIVRDNTVVTGALGYTDIEATIQRELERIQQLIISTMPEKEIKVKGDPQEWEDGYNKALDEWTANLKGKGLL